MSDSDSDESVGARAARERYQPGTQEDYNNALQHIEDYVKETYTREHEVYQRCMENDKLKMPVDFALSKFFYETKFKIVLCRGQTTPGRAAEERFKNICPWPR